MPKTQRSVPVASYDVVDVDGLVRLVAAGDAQEVFLEVWQQAPRFDGRAKTWIMTLAHRRAVDTVRRSEAQKRHDRFGVPDEVDHGEPADTLIKDEEYIRVRRCLRSMTELQLESVRLAYYQGYTYSEVAALLDKPLPRGAGPTLRPVGTAGRRSPVCRPHSPGSGRATPPPHRPT